MKHSLILTFIAFSPLLAQAADLPNVVNQNKAASQQMCIDRATDDCINTVCINSSSINCTDNCKSAAQDKCKGMSEE